MWSQFQALLNDFVQVPTYHLLLESFLLFWILWLLARRFLQKRARNRADLVKLTKEEEEELLAEWKPEPLVPLNLEPEEPLPVIEGKAGKETGRHHLVVCCARPAGTAHLWHEPEPQDCRKNDGREDRWFNGLGHSCKG